MSDDDQLSTVQILWRDRREEFEAYLRGESEIWAGGNYLITAWFESPAERYKFVPKPKPPQLRPLTHNEWIDRRDWWVRPKVGGRMCRVDGINDDSISGWGSFAKALELAEMSPDCENWQPCGVPDSEVTE